jgi:signal transduction histidine kinase
LVKLGTRAVLSWILVLVAVLGAAFVVAEFGYQRLNALNVRISSVQERQTLLAQLLAAVNAAETSQRGLLLTGNEIHLDVYEGARVRTYRTLERLREHYDRHGVQTGLHSASALRASIDQRFSQMEQLLTVYHAKGATAAIAEARSLDGLEEMAGIRAVASTLEAQEADSLVNTLASWLADLDRMRWAMGAITFASVVLTLVLGLRAMRHMRRRARENADLQKEVQDRTQELTALSSHLQQVSEREKEALSRDLQDALGGPLVATKMDVVWLRNRLKTADAALEERFDRIQRQLDQGVDFKRRVVEQLRPTLLDHMGLFTALRWLFQDTCGRAGVEGREQVPESELRLSGDAAISLYRVAQEALTNVIKHARATRIALHVEVTREQLHMAIADNGRGIASSDESHPRGHGLASMRHRMRSLGGTCSARLRDAGGTEIHVEVPLERILDTTSTQPIAQGCR